MSPYSAGRKSKWAIATRRKLLVKQNGCCVYCGKSINKKTVTIDHVVPKSAGGKSVQKNLVGACQPCNARKSAVGVEMAIKILKVSAMCGVSMPLSIRAAINFL